MSAQPAESVALETTPLHDLHQRLGARMVPFAGYSMPLHYPPGQLKEHLHTRAAAGLFDVSHMGQILLRGEDPAAIARALEGLIPADLVGLKVGRQRYGLLTDAAGGILDDLMVARFEDHVVVVVNAANKKADAAHLRAHLPAAITVEERPDALLALQGPAAEAALAALAPEVAAMRFLDVRAVTLLGAPGFVARSGYTGEDGFEISVPAAVAAPLAEALLAQPGVQPVGLGARDTLRLEAGLCLHGADIGPDTSPVEAGLTFAIPKVRRRGGAREGGFPGAARILHEFEAGPARRRVGLRPEGRAPVRAGAPLLAEAGGAPLGRVTSGSFGPSLGGPVAMGYVAASHAADGTRIVAEVRGQALPLAVTPLPFLAATFKRD
ncbi:glycine cleavage system T protein [Methylobacterium sp. 4-46]|uniref:glycine cleavage system aminomethyltransferase GcvT n=1 Tax=unclassified Methylobacterium TaxID=2615210 RepID=UPI000152E33A|nr:MULTISPECIES: glycine cleavage system aminomethyltransferase GcvT [Methylobacterium]ACA17909.1 glycine cleavage system T protein [Methylobacterium sp. 4-46]WFT77210.1 glycine cleavage system aminomethyltransferase GcvT [Methylobacterium nodulans]